MKILLLAVNDKEYIAKTHQAFFEGLLGSYDCRPYGLNHPGYDPDLRDLRTIASRVFPDGKPDIIFIQNAHSSKVSEMCLDYEGAGELGAIVVTLISDYWQMTDNYPREFLTWLDSAKVDFVMCYYPQLAEFYRGSGYEDRFIWIPPTFSPKLFNDWQMPKEYDVGLIGTGVTEFDGFYPERWAIHNQLLGQSTFRYLTKPHAGWGYHAVDHPQVGRGFSRHIGSCKMFVATGGKYNLPLARYFETMASGSLLLAIEPVGAEQLHLKDGINYAKITPETVVDVANYYLNHPNKLEEVAESGYQYAMSMHSGHQRAIEFYNKMREAIRRRRLS